MIETSKLVKKLLFLHHSRQNRVTIIMIFGDYNMFLSALTV